VHCLKAGIFEGVWGGVFLLTQLDAWRGWVPPEHRAAEREGAGVVYTVSRVVRAGGSEKVTIN